jgi:hypothetical protein
MLRPHHAEKAKLRQARRTPQDREHPFIFIGLQAEFGGKLGSAFGGEKGGRSGHDVKLMARRGSLVKMENTQEAAS